MLVLEPKNILAVNNLTFPKVALELFNWQYMHNAVYQKFVKSLAVNVAKVTTMEQIPFLPISFFKTMDVCTTTFMPEITFTSSGTTGQNTSKHLVKQVDIYTQSFRQGFAKFYGDVANYCVIGLLPSYLERSGSSLVFMVNDLVQQSQHPSSGFYLSDLDKLYELLVQLEESKQPTLLIGVTFALLDFAKKYPMKLHYTTIMETGGMKGRGVEPTRQEVQAFLQQQLGVPKVHSEYGMTELLSQAYSKGNGVFSCANTMQVLVRSNDDPLEVKNEGKGILNIIDLANVYSCSFIATDDVSIVHNNGSFEVQGRLDNSDIRGCSLLAV